MAKELTQQCFIRLWQYRHTLSADHPLEKQVFTIARSQLIKGCRRGRLWSRIELALEGFRFNDLARWNHGNRLTLTWDGIYVPVLDQPMDLNGDGYPDIC